MSIQSMLERLDDFENDKIKHFKVSRPISAPIFHKIGVNLIASELAPQAVIEFTWDSMVLRGIMEDQVTSVIKSIRDSESRSIDINVSYRSTQSPRIEVKVNPWTFPNKFMVVRENEYARMHWVLIRNLGASEELDRILSMRKDSVPILFGAAEYWEDGVLVQPVQAKHDHSRTELRIYATDKEITLNEVEAWMQHKFPDYELRRDTEEGDSGEVIVALVPQ